MTVQTWAHCKRWDKNSLWGVSDNSGVSWEKPSVVDTVKCYPAFPSVMKHVFPQLLGQPLGELLEGASQLSVLLRNCLAWKAQPLLRSNPFWGSWHPTIDWYGCLMAWLVAPTQDNYVGPSLWGSWGFLEAALPLISLSAQFYFFSYSYTVLIATAFSNKLPMC